MADPSPPWRETTTGIVLRLRVTPRSARAGLDGLRETASGQVLQIKLRAPPEDGKANAEAVAILSRALEIPQRDIQWVSGAQSRLKTVSVSGRASDLIARLIALTGETP